MTKTYLFAGLCIAACAVVAPAKAQQANAPATATAAPGDSAVDAKAAAKAAKALEREKADLRRKYGEGPYPGELDAFLGNKPEPLKPLLTTLYLGGERNAVLNLDRVGLAAMEAGEWTLAEHAFDMALTRIEAVYAKNKAAEQAKSLFKKESRKDFKGEPYERAMTYYYRGLLYLRSGDFDNAHAAFSGALYQDSINLDGERGQDFASMNYLAGWASRCAGDGANAREQFDFATKTNPTLIAPAPQANTVLVAELGYGPTKVKGGAKGELLEFRSNTEADENVVEVRDLSGATKGAIVPVEAASLAYQATERDGRKMDGVLKQKAETKAAMEAAGNTMMQNAMLQSSNPYNQGGALGGALIGMGLSLFASAARVDADVRQWDSLPARIMIRADKIDVARFKPQAVFRKDGEARDLKPAGYFLGGNDRCKIAWLRSRSALDRPVATPGEDAGVAKANAARKDVQLKDKAFRDSLRQL